MINLSAVMRSFAAGAAGGAANVLLLLFLWHFKIIPGPPELNLALIKGFLYRQMVWGGIWGFAFLIPVLTRGWVLRGVVWGAAATAVALFVFKVVPFNLTNVIVGLVVNSGAWGLTASWLYQKSGRNTA